MNCRICSNFFFFKEDIKNSKNVEKRVNKKKRVKYLALIRNCANWIWSGVPVMLTWRSGLPSSKSAIFILAPLTSLIFKNMIYFIILILFNFFFEQWKKWQYFSDQKKLVLIIFSKVKKNLIVNNFFSILDTS